MTNRNEQWVTIQEASEIIGRSENAVRLLVKRGKFDQLKKVRKSGRGYWVIHRDSITRLVNSSQWVTGARRESGSDLTNVTNGESSIPLHHYEEQRSLWLQERDQLQTGLMMYRFKFEELEKQVKMLPAPVEVVSSRMPELETRVKELEADLEQARRPWWKKLLGLK